MDDEIISVVEAYVKATLLKKICIDLKIFFFNSSRYKVMIVSFSKKYSGCCIYIIVNISIEGFHSVI